MTLSAYLREGTADVHRAAERSAFVARFAQGQLDRDLYGRHLLALHRLYAALEDALARRQDDQRVSAFNLPPLWRRAALERDLAFLRGADWSREAPVPAADAYAGRLETIERAEPLRLISHAYVRYLGDLSGGQVLKKLAARQLGLEGEGLHFYEFPEIADHAAYKDDFRRRLDAIPLSEGEREALLDEARTAFALNGAIFDELI